MLKISSFDQSPFESREATLTASSNGLARYQAGGEWLHVCKSTLEASLQGWRALGKKGHHCSSRQMSLTLGSAGAQERYQVKEQQKPLVLKALKDFFGSLSSLLFGSWTDHFVVGRSQEADIAVSANMTMKYAKRQIKLWFQLCSLLEFCKPLCTPRLWV